MAAQRTSEAWERPGSARALPTALPPLSTDTPSLPSFLSMIPFPFSLRAPRPPFLFPHTLPARGPKGPEGPECPRARTPECLPFRSRSHSRSHALAHPLLPLPFRLSVTLSSAGAPRSRPRGRPRNLPPPLSLSRCLSLASHAASCLLPSSSLIPPPPLLLAPLSLPRSLGLAWLRFVAFTRRRLRRRRWRVLRCPLP